MRDWRRSVSRIAELPAARTRHNYEGSEEAMRDWRRRLLFHPPRSDLARAAATMRDWRKRPDNEPPQT